MKILEGEASDILKDWVEGRYEVYYKYDGDKIFMIELYEFETNTTFLPSIRGTTSFIFNISISFIKILVLRHLLHLNSRHLGLEKYYIFL